MAGDGLGAAWGVEAVFRRLERSARRRESRALARLASRGLAPAARVAVHGPWCPDLSWGLTPGAGGEVELRIRGQRPGAGPALRDGAPAAIWGRGWPEAGVRLDACGLLGFLADSWPALAGDFFAVPLEGGGRVDFRRGLGRPDLPRLRVHREGRDIEVVGPRSRSRPGSEGLMVAESLAALGDALARSSVPEGARAAWARARARDLLPPVYPEWEDAEGEQGPDGGACPARGRARESALYYAARFGLSPEVYERAALWESAHHALWRHGLVGGAETRGGDGLRAAVLGSLPGRDEVLDMHSRARSLEEGSGDGAGDSGCRVARALDEQNLHARQAVFYRLWPRRGPPDFARTARLDPAGFAGEERRVGGAGAARVLGSGGLSAAGEALARVRFAGDGREAEVRVSDLADWPGDG